MTYTISKVIAVITGCHYSIDFHNNGNLLSKNICTKTYFISILLIHKVRFHTRCYLYPIKRLSQIKLICGLLWFSILPPSSPRIPIYLHKNSTHTAWNLSSVIMKPHYSIFGFTYFL